MQNNAFIFVSDLNGTVMNKKRKQYLINKFEARQGQSGRFYYLFVDFQSIIAQLHNNGASVYDIGDAIEEAMDYKFSDPDPEKLYNPTDPFYRAIKNNIKSKVIGKPKALSKSPAYKQVVVPAKSESSKVDRSDMISSDETKNPFEHDPS